MLCPFTVEVQYLGLLTHWLLQDMHYFCLLIYCSVPTVAISEDLGWQSFSNNCCIWALQLTILNKEFKYLCLFLFTIIFQHVQYLVHWLLCLLADIPVYDLTVLHQQLQYLSLLTDCPTPTVAISVCNISNGCSLPTDSPSVAIFEPSGW